MQSYLHLIQSQGNIKLQFVPGMRQVKTVLSLRRTALQNHPPVVPSSTAMSRFKVLASKLSNIVEVAELKGIRAFPNEDPEKPPRIEYLVKWKDDSPDTWEPPTNLADDLLRDYEQQWWGAVKKGNEDAIYRMMQYGGAVLARTVDENYRTALFFAAALGKAPLVERLVKEGAEVNMADKEGYTALHMAAGYMHVSTINALLAAGADPEQPDRKGRSPLELVESLRDQLPPNNPSVVSRRIALEEVIKTLTENIFEDVEPMQILDCRPLQPPADAEPGTPAPPGKEYLVLFPDDADTPHWVHEKYMSQEVVEDFLSGLEYAEAEAIVDVRNRGDAKTYLVRWRDGYPDTWEPEENVSQDLIDIFEGRKGDVETGSQLQLENA